MSEMGTIETRIGYAWQLHREGRNVDSIREFQQILSTATENVDAHYGLGLALRADGQLEAAAETFEQALTLSKRRLEYARKRDPQEQDNESKTTEADRHMMLNRMISQRIEELQAKR